MIVQTSRMLLRPVERCDVDDLVRLDSDPHVMHFVSGGIATPRSLVEEWVVPRAQTELRTGRGGLWTVIDRRYGVFLGWVSLRAPRHSSRPELELTYRLRREYWGRGLATEAARIVTDLAFTDLDAQRVFASATSTHAASRRVMEKLGMRICGIHVGDENAPGGFGEVEYDLLREDWQRRHEGWGASTDLTA
ncbi:putative acetyltransferase (plasmid) [Gordonia polyisoprenivorans VH2]|uniref:GNAT family N-acetyltransferase n=2 Tax=Gordonia polyisoprenivorans TaxID=84595 RepID=A0A846WSM0_9ACTN|nr:MULTISPECIES: GNAT family N-acetyltransferase [Gordonia]AFA76116.1 putative acetyltransferase [Gordonia polyisoprenivorans VH2]MBE7194681.1 GNAT family N-acetyltransferase [Gordonia polyisoprenivorans]MDF3283302.1 GNAT family N-acetyltransferase [Gordonia sp. N1V]NKY04147.1 GNAT family N-acetyltransferase [Gordonia polyisoprenivorans]OPX15125.1 N-acetyltransferase [Gordonia sp. i37]